LTSTSFLNLRHGQFFSVKEDAPKLEALLPNFSQILATTK